MCFPSCSGSRPDAAAWLRRTLHAVGVAVIAWGLTCSATYAGEGDPPGALDDALPASEVPIPADLAADSAGTDDADEAMEVDVQADPAMSGDAGADADAEADGEGDAGNAAVPPGGSLEFLEQNLSEEARQRREAERLRVIEAAQPPDPSVDNLARAQAFLAENRQRDGVVEVDGVQYQVLEEGDGAQPNPGARVRVRYEGTLLNGAVFDSNTAEFGLNGVIQGWQIAVPLMQEGSRWRVWIPPDLGYGAAGKAPIGPNELLIFDMTLEEVVDGGPASGTADDEAAARRGTYIMLGGLAAALVAGAIAIILMRRSSSGT